MALRDRIAAFRDMIYERSDKVPAEASALYDLLIAPVESSLAGASRVWIAADGALQLLPFGALRDRQGTYLAKRMAVAAVPSLTVGLGDRGARRPAELSAFVLAAPTTSVVTEPEPPMEGEEPPEDDARGAYMPIRGAYMPLRGAYMPVRGETGLSLMLDSMASIPLPGAKAEGEKVAALFPGSVLVTGADATKARLSQDGARCGVLHLATHGYVDPDIPEFSGLLFAGQGEAQYQVLTAQEVYGWSLNARLVTLSACQTGLGMTVEGEGLLGLGRAFIAAGAQDVVCSLWPVSDESTERLMTTMYSALPTAGSVEEALKVAQVALPADPATAHPFYWAAFVPIHGPRAK